MLLIKVNLEKCNSKLIYMYISDVPPKVSLLETNKLSKNIKLLSIYLIFYLNQIQLQFNWKCYQVT